jgi:hypothetical protein
MTYLRPYVFRLTQCYELPKKIYGILVAKTISKYYIAALSSFSIVSILHGQWMKIINLFPSLHFPL